VLLQVWRDFYHSAILEILPLSCGFRQMARFGYFCGPHCTKEQDARMSDAG